ncbi:hypothetical protein [Streptomyces sp. enrichment culture]|uniref:hypothetical protein n=1 Tax=Streptomyces sp. enrichment culture TaxID=1795815 RepID=UPI003F577EB0
MSHPAPPVYEARFGFDRRTCTVLLVCAAFCAGALLPGMPTAARIAVLALFGGGGLVLAVGPLTRKAALRVDETGVLLGGSPLRYRATTAHVPWGHIEAVALWSQQLPAGEMPYIGLVRHEGAPPLPGPRGRMAQAIGDALTPVPFEVLMASRAVNGWRLDTARLTAAVTHFAPQVRIVGTH